jgi:potassium channel subfamily K, other eukaryote
MNDPGLDPAIAETANEFEDRAQDGSKEPDGRYVHWTSADRQLEQYLQPATWWYASTEIPLIAATLGPMANAFSVCSLAQKWTEIVTPGEGPYAGQELPDPAWEIAINAVSLAAALFANLCLLLAMTQKMPFDIALPIVILGWYIASVLLIVILAIVAHQVLSPENASQGMQMSEAYYYGCIAAGLYFLLPSLLIITVYGAVKGHYSRKFYLSQSQRTLMIQTVGFLVYILAGSAVYSHIEGWKFCDAMWWSDFTILTIGIGYPAPTTHLGRGLLFPYAFGGILIIGIVIGSIRSLVLERGKNKISSRLLERTRSAFTRVMAKSEDRGTSGGVLGLLPVGGTTELNHEERAKQEFYAMRKVRQLAHIEHRWLSLLTSGFAVGILWFIGALIFEHAEATQQWSYFEALYYAFTSLLTIGYGDVYNISSWGRAFFVFWSLLAVPAMTMFISNLGDTFIRQFRDFANFIGELTLLPGDMGYRQRFGQLLHAELWPFTLSKPGSTKKSSRIVNQDSNEPIERVEEALEEEQLREEQEARKRGDVISENIHHHQYLLMRELREMFKWINSTPVKEFDYDEWVYFLKLLGEDKSVEEVGSEAHANGQDQSKWSWISHRSPLLGDKPEAEWLLEALADKLERELRQLSDEYRARERKDKQ